MATTYRYHKDSLDDIDEKGYSEQSDDDEMTIDLFTSTNDNNFMQQVHHQRRQSFSYSKHSENDSDDDAIHQNNIQLQIDIKNPYYYDDIHNKLLSPLSTSHRSNHDHLDILSPLKRERTDTLSTPTPTLKRRHSADKVLSKPCTKHINSVDYLNRMVITLRAKITSYKEDLKIAGELGQNLYLSNSKKDELIDEYKVDIRKLKRITDELSNAKNQLIQTTKIDAEHTKQLETDLHLQMSTSLSTTSKYEQQCVHLREELKRTLSEIRHLRQLNDEQRIEIETLETRNEQIAINAGETIDDLSQELAEEKDGHCNLKHKYQMLRNECTKLKINYEKRGTEIKTLKKTIHDKDLRILNISKSNSYVDNNLNNGSIRKQEMKLLYRQIDNFKDEMEGISKHLDLTKTYLKTTINYLENTVLLKNRSDIKQIYTLCDNARQFLGITEPPPTPNIDIEPPMLPTDHCIETVISSDDDMDIAMPREPTPPLKVSNIERVPISVPALHNTPPPPHIPMDINNNVPIIKESKPKVKISQRAQHPPPSIPLPPPPPSPHTPHNVKLHSAGLMPAPIKTVPIPSLPPSSQHSMMPSIPNEQPQPKVKIKASAMTPITSTAPIMPRDHNMNAVPMPRQPPLKCNVIDSAMIPCIAPPLIPCRVKAPKVPDLPPKRDRKAITHSVGVMPVPIVDVKRSVPCIPQAPSDHVPLPQQPKHKVKITASAMAPPIYAPPLVPTPEVSNVPTPKEDAAPLVSVKSSVGSHNEEKRKKKKKSKKTKKKGDSMEEQKQHLTRFFSTYSDNKNWTEGDKENGVQKYILKFAEREPLNARMAFLYSMTLYLGQIVGVNKRCISHAFMLFKSVRAQIDTLSDEFALILQTLEHHNDDKLWKYVYSFLYNAAAYFKHIQRFVGTRTSVDNPRKYSRALKAGSRDFSNLNRRDSSFRKLSGLSEVSADSMDYNRSFNDNAHQRERMIYGNNENNDYNKRRKKIKVLRK